jgi:hypothetical protein
MDLITTNNTARYELMQGKTPVAYAVPQTPANQWLMDVMQVKQTAKPLSQESEYLLEAFADGESILGIADSQRINEADAVLIGASIMAAYPNLCTSEIAAAIQLYARKKIGEGTPTPYKLSVPFLIGIIAEYNAYFAREAKKYRESNAPEIKALNAVQTWHAAYLTYTAALTFSSATGEFSPYTAIADTAVGAVFVQAFDAYLNEGATLYPKELRTAIAAKCKGENAAAKRMIMRLWYETALETQNETPIPYEWAKFVELLTKELQ